MNPADTPCPPHLVGKLYESPLPAGKPPLPDGFAHVKGPLTEDGISHEYIMSSSEYRWWGGCIGDSNCSYAVPRHWLASELPKAAEPQPHHASMPYHVLDDDAYWLRVFAGQALAGIICNDQLTKFLIEQSPKDGHGKIASHACEFAEAMISEIKRRAAK